MMRFIYKLSVLLITMITVLSCNDAMEEYYRQDTEATVDMTVLELIDQTAQFSTFSKLFREYDLDTVFNSDRAVTLFVPDNDAFATTYDLFLDTLAVMQYYVSETYINVAHIQGESVVQTLGKKYVTITSTGAEVLYDDALVNYESPLCKDGKFYGINTFVQPAPSLYEYIAATNAFYKTFIDLQDSKRLDPNSTPIGYDTLGNTVYDTIWIEENLFEIDYFPINQELRDERATLLLFTAQQMEEALLEVSENLGLASVEDIPAVWINDIMLPSVTDQSVFARELTTSDFASGTVKNINGDSVEVNVDDISTTPFQCSNGYAYNYTEFSIPEELYYGTGTINGTDLAVKIGVETHTWAPDVVVNGLPFIPDPIVEFNQKLGNEILSVSMNQSTSFDVSTQFQNIFPGQYLLLFNVKCDPSGVYKVYANGELMQYSVQNGFFGTVTTDFIDLFDWSDVNKSYKYISDTRYPSVEGFRTFEILIDNITEYGDVEITFEYQGPSPKNPRDPKFILNHMTLQSWNK